MIAFYNSNVGDILMLIVADNEGKKLDFECKSTVTRVFRTDTGVTVAWNIFQPSITVVKNGEVKLTDPQLVDLNKKIVSVGYSETIKTDKKPKLVVAEIVEMRDHPDSDHLHICKVAISNDRSVELSQIVCGATNARVGLKTVAALSGTMMPSGALIWSGVLRGISSYGMLCSPRELALSNAPQTRGIIELSEKTSVGEAFDPVTMWGN